MEIKIEVPKGYKLKGFNKETNTIEFEKEINLLAELVEKYAINTEGLEQDDVAFKVLKKIVKEVNGGWIPNWKDNTEKKWYPCFNMDDFSLDYCIWRDSASYSPASLVFKSEKLCREAVEKYFDVFKIYFNGSDR